MSTRSLYHHIDRIGQYVIAVALLVLLASCEAPETPPPDPTPLAGADSMGSAPAPEPARSPEVAPPPPATPVAAPAAVTPIRAASFCALCTEALQRGWIIEHLESYRSQCSQCPSELPVAAAGPAAQMDRTAGGYTVIVLSSTARTEAEAAAARVRRDLGSPSLPVGILESSGDATTRYRVGVGQVATVEAAVALRDRLASALPRDAWVTRIK